MNVVFVIKAENMKKMILIATCLVLLILVSNVYAIAECSQNSDCGTDGWICSDAFKKYRSYFCTDFDCGYEDTNDFDCNFLDGWTCNLQNNVQWISEDTITKGDWYFNPKGSPIGVYGSYAHILPNAPQKHLEVPVGDFSAPIGFDFGNQSTWNILKNPPYNWTNSQVTGLNVYKADTSYWDEYESQSPEVTYSVSGTRFIPPSEFGIDYVQYPVFEWTWNDWQSYQTDPREVYYTKAITGTGGGPGWRLATWDDGNERSQPENGYMNFNLTFPEGTYLLSLYAYDYERAPNDSCSHRDSQEYRIYDTNGNLLASKRISDGTFDEGIYEIFKIVAPPEGLTIILQVYNDAGHHYPCNIPYTINLVLSGIFVDKISSCQCLEDNIRYNEFRDYKCVSGNCTYEVNDTESFNCDSYDCKTESLTCEGVGTDTIKETGDDYSCGYGICIKDGTRDCSGPWVCDDKNENTTVSCGGEEYKCFYDDGYKWNITPPTVETNCNDNHDNDLDGLIDSQDPDCKVPDTTPPAPSGGGGFTCTKIWNCSDWSPCSEAGLQTRDCIEINKCNPNPDKKQENRTCTYIPPTYCGDKTCQSDENCTSCPKDCGDCPPVGPICGNNLCEVNETCTSCELDCGKCPPEVTPLPITGLFAAIIGNPIYLFLLFLLIIAILMVIYKFLFAKKKKASKKNK